MASPASMAMRSSVSPCAKKTTAAACSPKPACSASPPTASAIGRWRTEEVVRDGSGANPKVDPSGELPSGQKFSSAAELKRILAADTARFASAFTEKLATYALRRAMTIDDRRALAEITAKCKANDFRIRDIIEALVVSDLFQTP